MSEIPNLPKGHSVLHSSTARFPMQNVTCKVHKIYDTANDSDYQLCFDQKNNKIDFDQHFKKELELYTKKYGKLHPVLFDTLHKNPGQPVEVMVWLRIETKEPFKTDFTVEELNAEEVPQKIKEARATRLKKVNLIVEDIVHETGIRAKRPSKMAPAFIATVTDEDVKKIAARKEVLLITLHLSQGINNLQASLNVSKAQQVVVIDGNKGTDIRVAVWEEGIDDTSNLVISGSYDSDPNTSSHARLTHAIIKNKEKGKPNGYAPECKLFSANDFDIEALEWALWEKSCRVISQSFHRDYEGTCSYLTSDDIYKDYLVLHFPYPTIIQAAGNIEFDESVGEFVNHKGYNSIAVGNHNDNASAMSTSSTFHNPFTIPIDRELPEIAANGVNVTAVGLTMSGTSFAAPAVAGSSAVLMDINSQLQNWPEGIRAILLAGATKNVSGNVWSKDNSIFSDAKDGAGALNLQQSAIIANHKKIPGNSGSQWGFDVGRLEVNDFKSNNFAKVEYNIKVPHKGPIHVKVALAWDAQNIESWEHPWELHKLSVDLDLKIFKGSTLVAHSSSFCNSYEIAEFDAKPGDELTIKIKKASGNEWTYFGIAWTVF